MSVDIKLKHSSVAGKVPTDSDLTAGEIGINTKDVKAYIKDADGNIVQLAGNDNPGNDGRYVQKAPAGNASQDISGDLTLGTDKITLNSTNGSAEFAGTLIAKGNAEFGEWADDKRVTITNGESNPNLELRYAANVGDGLLLTGRKWKPAPDDAYEDTSKIYSDGSAEFAGGDITLNEDGTANFTGVLFNDDTADANKLDDYEEGNFTVNGVTATYKSGRYTKIGNLVTITMVLESGGGQDMTIETITGLPFKPATVCDSSGSWYLAAADLTAHYGSGQCIIKANTFDVKLNTAIDRTSNGAGGGDYFTLCISYRTSS